MTYNCVVCCVNTGVTVKDVSETCGQQPQRVAINKWSWALLQLSEWPVAIVVAGCSGTTGGLVNEWAILWFVKIKIRVNLHLVRH